jgi:hypothetical protein
VAVTVAANRRRLKRMAARLAEFSKAKAGAHASDTQAKVRARRWRRSVAAREQAAKDAEAAKRKTSEARERVVRLEVNLRQREARDARSKEHEAARSAEQLLQRWRKTEEKGKLMFADALQKAHRQQAAELLAPPTAVNLLQGWRDAEEQGRRMVSHAIESAKARHLASPAPPHAPSPSTKKTAPVATTAAQRIARLQTQIRTVRAEEATMAEELAKVVDGRKPGAESLKRGKERRKKGVRGGVVHTVQT